MIESNALSLLKFIKKSNQIHAFRYNYNLLEDMTVSDNPKKYISLDVPVFIACKTHGEFIETPRNHLKGTGCPYCNNDVNIRAIESILYEYKIIAEKDFSFPHCSWKFTYDFYLPDYNVIIQFHDITHKAPLTEFGSSEYRSIREADIFRDSLAKQMRVGILYITSKHLEVMTRDELGKYIINILETHKKNLNR